MTLLTLHTISTHKKYRELLAEWTVEDTKYYGDQDRGGASKPDAAVLMSFRTRPPMDGEVALFDAPLDDEETDEEEEAKDETEYQAGKHAPAPRPVSKVPAQRAPDEFMCGVTAQPGRMVVHVPNMTVSD
jgi:hypothetical protein